MSKRWAKTCPREGTVYVVSRADEVMVLVHDPDRPDRPPFMLNHARRLSDALIQAGENVRAIRLARTSKRAGGVR